MSRRMQRLAKRNARKTQRVAKNRPCSRCRAFFNLAKDARIHFREVHTFACMWRE